MSSQVQLSVSCSGLRDRDVGSKSDPMCVMFTSSSGGHNQKKPKWDELGRTEVVKDTLNPAWQHRFVLPYR